MPDAMYPQPTREIAQTGRDLAPGAQAAFDAFGQAAFEDGALSAKVKQIVAVAVAQPSSLAEVEVAAADNEKGTEVESGSERTVLILAFSPPSRRDTGAKAPLNCSHAGHGTARRVREGSA
jgi:hypothetical protein